MSQTENRIFAIVAAYFPGLDFFHQNNGGLHSFKMIFFPPDENYTIKTPDGFFITDVQAQGSRVVFTMIVSEDVFAGTYHFIDEPEPAVCYV